MATDKKHIAVYLAPEVEQALIAFCQEKGLISKKGTMYSAGVNVALAHFFGITDTETSNTSLDTGNIPTDRGMLPVKRDSIIPDNIPGIIPDNIPGNIPGNIPSEALVMEAMPGK
jgi:hypothetical protein